MADLVTKVWRDKYGTPLLYAAGSEFVVNNLAVYSPDRPHEPELTQQVADNPCHRVVVVDHEDRHRHIDGHRSPSAGAGPLELRSLSKRLNEGARRTGHPYLSETLTKFG